MTDNLRARILRTLIKNTPPKYLAMPEDLSNLVTALIRDLGLRKQSQTGEIVNVIEGDGINYGRHRYVTEWEADDES